MTDPPVRGSIPSGRAVRGLRPEALETWHTLPSRYTADRVVDVDRVPRDIPGPPVPTRPVPPFTKDYDAVESPSRWSRFLDVSNWGVLVVDEGGEQVGGAVVAWRTPWCHMLEGRDDLAVLWDLRVAATARRRGVGRTLVEAAAAWATSRGAVELKVETQDVNPGACALYAACGFRLAAVGPGAYRDLPAEVQLFWRRELP